VIAARSLGVRIKVYNFSTIMLIVFIWLAVGIGIVFFSPPVAKAYMLVSIFVLLVLLLLESAERRNQGAALFAIEYPKISVSRGILCILLIVLWVLAMQGILFVSPYKGTGFTFIVWAVWVGVLILFIRYLELRFLKKSSKG
jgi:hypothetical protein